MINNLSKVIRAKHVTEKSSRVLSENQYVFKVHLKAEKPLIKKAVEEEFKVKVHSINTMVIGGKHRRFGKTIGKRSDWKKAYVTLEKGYFINIDSTSTTKG